MTNFLSEFLAYFFPEIATYPDWLLVLLGCFLMCFIFRMICAIINIFGGVKL